MSSPHDAAPPRLLVEHRLCLALSALDCLERLSSLADETHSTPLFDDVPSFARIAWQLARVTEAHLRAAKAALPPECLNVDAPLVSGGVR